MRSDLRQTSLSTILRHLYSERRSGILHVSRHSIKKRVHFREGAIVFADNGDAESAPSRERAREIMFSLFTWTSGDVVFEDWETNISEALAFESPTAELILEATRSIEDEEILGRLLGTQESVFACTQTTELPLFKMRLSPAESSVLTFARQRKQFQRWDLPRVSGELPLMRALNTLVSVGLLEIREKVELAEPQPPPMPEPPPSLAQVQPSTPEPLPAPVAQEAPAPAWSPEPIPVVNVAAPDAPDFPSPPTPGEVESIINNHTPSRSAAPAPSAGFNEVEQLLDAFESNRAHETGRHAQVPSPAPAPFTPPTPAASPEPPHDAHVEERDFPMMAEASPPPPFEPPPRIHEPEPPQFYEPAAPEPAPPSAIVEETPLPRTSLPPPSRRPAAPRRR